jgi:hypothetical protein
MSSNLQTVIQGYLYAGVSAAAALWMSGVHDFKTIGVAAVTAVVGPLLQVINPKDGAIGVGAASAVVEPSAE